MDKSIIQLVDELPTDNITVKVLKALDYIVPGQWENLVGFDNSIRAITQETDAGVIQRIRDRATALYQDPQKGYQAAIKLYQTIDKADTAMATAALANKVGEKIGFLSFLSNITPKADTTQSIDLALKIAVEILAFCKLNGLPQPNPQVFATSLADNYKYASLMRMIVLVCVDGILPLGPDFLTKIQSTISGADTNVITQNPLFLAVNNLLPGGNPVDKLGFINQGFSSVQGWMNNLVAKTGITPQSISGSLGNFVQLADDNLDFVAAFLDQTTNYYEHTGIQTVARSVISEAHTQVKAEIAAAPRPNVASAASVAGAANAAGRAAVSHSSSNGFAVGQTVEAWDVDGEDWYQATIEKIDDDQYFVHYVGYGSSEDEWLTADDLRSRDRSASDDNGFAVGQKVKCWDEEEEEWYSAIIQKTKGNKYFIHYIDYDSAHDEWVEQDEIC
jgi:RNA binding activity-knot of a chromodomain